MEKFINNLYKNQALLYKVFLFIVTTALIIYLFPKGGKFKYEISKGKPWQYETLLAPFDFAIQKTDQEIKQKREQIKENHAPFFDYEQNIPDRVKENLDEVLEASFGDSIMRVDGLSLVKFSKNTIDDLYERGVIKPRKDFKENQIIFLKKDNEAKEIVYRSLFKIDDLDEYISQEIENANLNKHRSELRKVLFEVL